LNRGRNDHALPLGPLMRWLCGVALIGLLGLCYVNLTHKLKADGNLCRDLEQAVRDLDEKLQVASGEIIRMTARPALERRRDEGFISMMPVAEERLVRLPPQTTVAALPGGKSETMP